MNKRYWMTGEDRERQLDCIRRAIRQESILPERYRRHRNSTAGGGGAVYENDFKVIPGPRSGTIQIVDGALPGALYCGDTDCGKVVSEVIDIHSGNDLWLVLQYDAEQGAYIHSFRWTDELLPEGNYGFVTLAHITEDGNIVQRWTGGTIYWAERYFV